MAQEEYFLALARLFTEGMNSSYEAKQQQKRDAEDKRRYDEGEEQRKANVGLTNAQADSAYQNSQYVAAQRRGMEANADVAAESARVELDLRKQDLLTPDELRARVNARLAQSEAANLANKRTRQDLTKGAYAIDELEANKDLDALERVLKKKELKAKSRNVDPIANFMLRGAEADVKTREAGAVAAERENRQATTDDQAAFMRGLQMRSARVASAKTEIEFQKELIDLYKEQKLAFTDADAELASRLYASLAPDLLKASMLEKGPDGQPISPSASARSLVQAFVAMRKGMEQDPTRALGMWKNMQDRLGAIQQAPGSDAVKQDYIAETVGDFVQQVTAAESRPKTGEQGGEAKQTAMETKIASAPQQERSLSEERAAKEADETRADAEADAKLLRGSYMNELVGSLTDAESVKVERAFRAERGGIPTRSALKEFIASKIEALGYPWKTNPSGTTKYEILRRLGK